MTYWISCSGGLSSAISAIVAYENELDFRMIFADVLMEDEDLYRFNNDLVKSLGVDLITVSTGKTPYDSFRDNRWIGNTRTAHCSDDLKTEPIRRFIEQFGQPDDPLVLGMDWGEMDRIENAQRRWGDRPVISLLNQYKITRDMYPKILEEYGLIQPRLYDHGFPHNNCGGACVKAGLKQWATMLDVFPEAFEKASDDLDQAMSDIGPTAKPFLRKTIKGKTHYLTLAEFKKMYLAGEIKISPYDFGGCGCFTDNMTPKGPPNE